MDWNKILFMLKNDLFNAIHSKRHNLFLIVYKPRILPVTGQTIQRIR